jgi:hypothetical protein
MVYGTYVLLPSDGSAYGEGGLHVIDASDPRAMEEVAHFPIDYPIDAGFTFPFVYVTNVDGLRLVDFSDLQQPEEVGFIDGNHSIRDIFTAGDYAYIADGESGLTVLNIQNPSQPQVIYIDSSINANDVVLNDTYDYVACGVSQLKIFDINDPGHPEEVANAYAGNAVSVDVAMPYAYVAGGDGLHIIDVSDVDSVEEVSYDPVSFLKEIVVSGNYAYLACGFDGMRIIDISNPESPREVSRIDALDWTTGVDVSGYYAYMADGYAGVRVIDVHDPRNPVPVAQSPAGYGNRLYVVEPHLYLAGGSYGLKVLDISIPESIHEVGHYGIASMGGIFADSDYIYYGTLDNGFYIFEFTPTGIISDPEGSDRIPRDFALYQNYPNPFNPSTIIEFDVPESAGKSVRVHLEIFDMRGRLIRTLMDEMKEPGSYKANWDGRDAKGAKVGSGMYLYQIVADDFESTRKLVMIK